MIYKPGIYIFPTTQKTKLVQVLGRKLYSFKENENISQEKLNLSQIIYSSYGISCMMNHKLFLGHKNAAFVCLL